MYFIQTVLYNNNNSNNNNNNKHKVDALFLFNKKPYMHLLCLQKYEKRTMRKCYKYKKLAIDGVTLFGAIRLNVKVTRYLCKHISPLYLCH